MGQYMGPLEPVLSHERKGFCTLQVTPALSVYRPDQLLGVGGSGDAQAMVSLLEVVK
jgi:hypothetical protein